MALSVQSSDDPLYPSLGSRILIPMRPGSDADGCKPVSSRPMTTQLQTEFAAWLASLRSWDLYLTLTYDSRREGYDGRMPSHWAAQSHLVHYHRRAQTLLGRSANLVGGLETTYLGAPHWHAMLSCGSVSRAEFAALSRDWFCHHGYARISRTSAPDAIPVATYIGKYLTKQGAELSLLGRFGPGSPVLTHRLPGLR